jgi:hypothetical protein
MLMTLFGFDAWISVHALPKDKRRISIACDLDKRRISKPVKHLMRAQLRKARVPTAHKLCCASNV